jgi:hypothetical protein
MFRFVAGLRLADGSLDAPDTEYYGKGFKRALFAPGCVTDPRLPSVAARITSVYGPIAVRWSKTTSALTMALTLPPNTCGDVVVPAPVLPESSVITESGKVVWENGAFVAVGNGVRNGSATADGIHFAVGSGDYTFLATLKSDDADTSVADTRTYQYCEWFILLMTLCTLLYLLSLTASSPSKLPVSITQCLSDQV